MAAAEPSSAGARDGTRPSRRTGRERLKGSLRTLGRPVLGYFDRRFQDVYDRIDDRLEGLYGRVATDVETLSELSLGMQRFVDLAERQAEDVLTRLREVLDATRGPGGVVGASARRRVEELFAIAAVGRLDVGARVLHVRAASSGDELALSLASLGYDVTTVGLPTAANHPDLSVVEVPVESWGGPAEPFDCVVWLDRPLDEEILDASRKWLDDDGQLVARMSLAAADGDRALLDDWWVLERRLFVLRPPSTWEAVDGPASAPPDGAATMVLVRATPTS